MLEACRSGEPTIVASDLPELVKPGTCPVGDRVIVDGGVGTVLPDRGEGVYAEVLTAVGARELQVTRYQDGTIELEHVGDDSGGSSAQAAGDSTDVYGAAASSPGACADPAYTNLGYRESSTLRYRFNRLTTPGELTPNAAEDAIRRGGNNIASVRNNCGLADGVPAKFVYEGSTPALADVTAKGRCSGNDSKSVVSFGKLPSGTLAVTCTFYAVRSGYDEVASSDMRINKGSKKWTTKPGARSCRNSYDLQSVATHERGHTFGLGHVAEASHGNLTMSGAINGPCQASERTLGRGDVIGLNRKYV